MTSAIAQEIEVCQRFDALEARFKPEVERVDVRLVALRDHLGDLCAGRLLDLGCGKGRFANRLEDLGAEVLGLDLSLAMLRSGQVEGRSRVRGSARRLPFRDSSFDAVYAVEVLQHVAPVAIGSVLAEACRVLRPGGRLVIVDRNALAIDPNRPWLPSLVVKWVDERRGRWMYPANSPARERWFWPGALERRLRSHFQEIQKEALRLPIEAGRWPFEVAPWTSRLSVWSATKMEVPR